MIGNPLSRLQGDLVAAGRDLDSTEPLRDYDEQLAAAFREEVPVVTGFLQSSVYADSDGVGVSAVYAGVVAKSNPYDDRALARTDPGDVFGDYVDQVLDDHLHAIYF